MSTTEVPKCFSWYARSRRVCNTLINLLNALHSGFWMSVLRDETFYQFDSYPHQFLSPHDEPRLARFGLEAWEEQLFAKQLSDCKSLLVIAGDGGREILSLARCGMKIHAVDYCANLVEATNFFLSRSRVKDRVTLMPRYEVPLYTDAHDVIWVGRYFLSTIHGRRRRIEFFQRLRAAADGETTLLLSFFIRQGNGLDWRLNYLLGRVGRFITRNPGEKVELGDHLDLDVPLYHHHYREDELSEELRCAGWKLSQYSTEWFGYAVAKPNSAAFSDDPTQPLLQLV